MLCNYELHNVEIKVEKKCSRANVLLTMMFQKQKTNGERREPQPPARTLS